jgi:hypothetical protein
VGGEFKRAQHEDDDGDSAGEARPRARAAMPQVDGEHPCAQSDDIGLDARRKSEERPRESIDALAPRRTQGSQPAQRDRESVRTTGGGE